MLRNGELQRATQESINTLINTINLILELFRDPILMLTERSSQRGRSIIYGIINLLLVLLISPVLIIYSLLFVVTTCIIKGFIDFPLENQNYNTFTGSSTSAMLNRMEGRLHASPSVPLPSSNEQNLSIYSEHTSAYIKETIKKRTFKQKIDDLIESLEKAGKQLTEKDQKLLDRFKDPITWDYMKIPVSLNEQHYDLSTLKQLSRNPFTREIFYLNQIQSARKLITKFDRTIEKIKSFHLENEQELSSPPSLTM
jgi:hypothetical protein